MVIDELVQIKKPKPLPIKPKDFQHVEFESANNHLTHGSIKKIDVLVHYYHNMHVHDNNVAICNDQSNTFSEALINVYNLEVFNPKGHVYS